MRLDRIGNVVLFLGLLCIIPLCALLSIDNPKDSRVLLWMCITFALCIIGARVRLQWNFNGYVGEPMSDSIGYVLVTTYRFFRRELSKTDTLILLFITILVILGGQIL